MYDKVLGQMNINEYYEQVTSILVCKEMGHSSVTTTEIYTKFEQSELIKDFPIEAVRLCDGGQLSEDSYQSDYNYGKA